MPSSSQASSNGGGAGDGVGDAGSDQSGGNQQQQSQGQVGTNNNPDGAGQGQYPQVYAPKRIGGDLGPDQMVLEPDGSGAPVVQGDFAQNPNGSASVPYSQVYGNYADSANHALDSGYIPLGMKDVVRDYFSSLDPSSNSPDSTSSSQSGQSSP
jgi:hypothetical protein